MKTIFYHDNCVDGLFAASCCFQHFPEAIYLAVNYGYNTPLFGEGKRPVLFVDFCPSVEWVKENIDKIESVTIYDHHKTSEDNVAPIKLLLEEKGIPSTILFDMGRSGGHITWDELIKKPLPPLAKVATDYDLGKELGEEEGYIELFSHFLRIEDQHEKFNSFFTYITQTDNDSLAAENEKLLLVNKLRHNHFLWFKEKIKVRSITLNWLPNKPKINVAMTYAPNYMITSFAKFLIADNPKIDLVLGVSTNAMSQGLSFRGKKEDNYARLIAEKFHGGGHDSAAGGVNFKPGGFNGIKYIIENGYFPPKPDFMRGSR